MTVSVAAILRGGRFSPNSVAGDAAILNAVAVELRRRGVPVTTYSEEQFIAHGIASEHIILAMTRDERSISRLHILEQQGRIIINSPSGIANCARAEMARRFEREDIPRPLTLIVPTDQDARPLFRTHGIECCWVKRADCQTVHKEDVARARHLEEAQELLSEFFIRGIRTATVTPNVGGCHVKFYGVLGSGFFHHYFTAADSAVSPAFNAEEFAATCCRAAQCLDVTIFGGDAMVNPADGSFLIISFNDWPGFAPCRPQAAKAIAKITAAKVRKLLRQ